MGRSTSIETPKLLIGGVLVSTLLAIFFAIAGVVINKVSDAPCSLENSDAKVFNFCQQIGTTMKVLLIATHLLSFFLLPFAMYVFYVGGKQLRELKANPFSSILGFAFLMVAIAGEIGWHVGQQWFYQEEYHILNFVFYFFFMLGIAFWAHGVKSTEEDSCVDLDKVLFTSPLLVTFVYGASAAIKFIYKCTSDSTCSLQSLSLCCLANKIIIYCLMALLFAVLTVRMFKTLGNDRRVLWVPFFSVFVNLSFILLLNKNRDDTFKNPLYHILHDLVGTEMGVFVAVLLVFTKTSEKASEFEPQTPLLREGHLQ